MPLNWTQKWTDMCINKVNEINIEEDKWVVYRLANFEDLEDKILGGVRQDYVTRRLGIVKSTEIKNELYHDMGREKNCGFFKLRVCDTKEIALEEERKVYKKVKDNLWVNEEETDKPEQKKI